jgi:acyl-CoA thioester hydrolase
LSAKLIPNSRKDYSHFSSIATRWGDNDSYGHVNNVVYYSYFDTAVNRHLIENGALDLEKSEFIGLVIENRCTFFSSLSFPDMVHVGLKVIHLGNSSVRYQIGLFRNEEEVTCAVGEFVHVYVNRATNQPVSIPTVIREVLQNLVLSELTGV